MSSDAIYTLVVLFVSHHHGKELEGFRIMHMTVSQLLAALTHLSEHGHAQDEVRIPVYEQGCMLGPRPSSAVVSVSPGIDYDSGVIFLNTGDTLIKS